MANTSDNFKTQSADMNTAMRDYLNALYGTTNADLAPLLQRFLKAPNVGTSDISNAWAQLITAANVGTS
jgi:hypothetical protein